LKNSATTAGRLLISGEKLSLVIGPENINMDRYGREVFIDTDFTLNCASGVHEVASSCDVSILKVRRLSSRSVLLFVRKSANAGGSNKTC
jgi:hypothetical protein